jgi:hypothetical protein
MSPLNGGGVVFVWQTPTEIAMQKRLRIAVRDGTIGFSVSIV